MQLRTCSTLALFAALLPMACSSGSGSSGGPGTPGSSTSQLLLDPTAGATTDVTVQVEVVALERADGSLTTDLLPGSGSLDLVRTDGATETLGIDAPPAGSYVALRILLAGSEAVVDSGGAARRISLGSRELRVPFANAVDASNGLLLGLRHTAAFVDPGENGTWQPALAPADPDVLSLRLARVDVASTSLDGTVLGTLGDRAVELFFAPDAVLLRDPDLEPLSIDAFVNGVAPGHRLLVDGLLELGRTVQVSAAVDLGPRDRSGRGNNGFGEIRGVILEFDDEDEFDMSVLEVLSGRDRLPDPLPRRIEVDVDDSRLFVVPQPGRPAGPIEADDLEVGMTVQVRWREPIDDDESWRGLGSPTSVGASRRSNVGVSAWEGTGDEASESSWMGIKRLCDCDAFSADSGKHDW